MNVLAKQPGSREAKLQWLEEELPLLEAQAGKEFDPVEEPKKFGAAVCSLAIRYWRWKVMKAKGSPCKGRDFTAERLRREAREKPQEAGPRDGKLTKLDVAAVLPLRREEP